MLEQADLDAVSVCLPNYLRAPAMIKCLRRGLQVLCEKPLAATSKDVKKIIAEARKQRRIVTVNFSQRFVPQAQALKAMIDEGAIGDVYFARTW